MAVIYERMVKLPRWEKIAINDKGGKEEEQGQDSCMQGGGGGAVVGDLGVHDQY